jgi:hypothetical protein
MRPAYHSTCCTLVLPSPLTLSCAASAAPHPSHCCCTDARHFLLHINPTAQEACLSLHLLHTSAATSLTLSCAASVAPAPFTGTAAVMSIAAARSRDNRATFSSTVSCTMNLHSTAQHNMPQQEPHALVLATCNASVSIRHCLWSSVNHDAHYGLT